MSWFRITDGVEQKITINSIPAFTANALTHQTTVPTDRLCLKTMNKTHQSKCHSWVSETRSQTKAWPSNSFGGSVFEGFHWVWSYFSIWYQSMVIFLGMVIYGHIFPLGARVWSYFWVWSYMVFFPLGMIIFFCFQFAITAMTLFGGVWTVNPPLNMPMLWQVSKLKLYKWLTKNCQNDSSRTDKMTHQELTKWLVKHVQTALKHAC